MRRRAGLVAVSVMVAGVPVGWTQPANEAVPVESGDIHEGQRLVNALESPEAVAKRLEWWSEARFGMFMHWGLYSAVGCHWKGTNGRSAHMMYYLEIPLKEYATIAGQFNPVQFDADQWVQIAKNAGMKYLIITSKHHEGFAMYDSKVNDYNIMARTPWKRDPMKELSEACRRAGIKFGVYYSLGRDWEDPDAVTRDNYKSNTWDYPEAEKKVFSKYFERKARPQVRELMEQYRPAVMWFDTPGNISRAESEELLRMIHEIDPNCIVNSRVGNRLGDYAVEEQRVPEDGNPDPWETCMTMNRHWAYYIGDEDWKSPRMLIHNLIDIASKGGNYLLNVGPTDQGVIQQAAIDRLESMGAWLKVNGEGIHGTSASPIGQPAWGRCTRRETSDGVTLYLHVFEWPQDGRLTVPAVKNDVVSASLLANGSALTTTSGGDGITIQLPATAPDSIASTVVLRLKGTLHSR